MKLPHSINVRLTFAPLALLVTVANAGRASSLDDEAVLEPNSLDETTVPIVKIPTALGLLSCWEFGTWKSGKPAALALNGAGNIDAINHEWFQVAAELAREGFYVLVPNFHSCDACGPGVPSGTNREAQLLQILNYTRQKSFDALLGKSAGGAIAANFAAAQPNVVRNVVLVAPALRSMDLTIRQPALLCWARDDPTISFQRSAGVSKCLVSSESRRYFVPTGGHTVLSEYTDKIVDFLISKSTYH
eukprot:TRINITY_DN51433_c0_g1_i1.p1 TRINITY_DN51433_c0_g1~~TRINITY_DN51433_c0_g1_i1.p1  ORF type:complete len:246 (-),score=28.72 TRINITY_DN51433_c0_g1_i1:274-1011(-)